MALPKITSFVISYQGVKVVGVWDVGYYNMNQVQSQVIYIVLVKKKLLLLEPVNGTRPV